MNKLNSLSFPARPCRYSFHEGWLMGILILVAFFQIGLSFHESAGLVQPGARTLSELPVKGPAVAKQPHCTTPAPHKNGQSSQTLALVARV